MKPSAFLFDLDGTLVDTAPDMAGALNRLRAENNLPALPYALIRPWVSHGAGALVRLGFGADIQAERLDVLKQRYLAIYAANLCVDSTLFPGMADVLKALSSQGRSWGVVTNKPAFLTEPLLAGLGLTTPCIVSGDTLPVNKPDPAPVRHACALLGLSVEECVMVGDHKRDIDAARAAGSPSIAAAFGYIQSDDNPHDWGADAVVQHADELHQWI
ncbi:MAG: phosphoglycolate phosphatase [Gammaproteobacteria bacterium 28-57-27]|nr:MAG: phosphoglycolate phosphatase [Gammaproteobacteria bacterium 28-57-27]